MSRIRIYGRFIDGWDLKSDILRMLPIMAMQQRKQARQDLVQTKGFFIHQISFLKKLS